MTSPEEKAERVTHVVRLQKTLQERCGMVLQYLKMHNYDVTREIELLLEMRFLPIVLKSSGKDHLAQYAAYEAIAQLEGLISVIQKTCNLPIEQNSANCCNLQQTANFISNPEREASSETNNDAEDSEQVAARILMSERMFGM